MLIAQISDLHLRACGSPLQGSIDTEAALAACIDHLLCLAPSPDAVLATGDLADFGRPEDYALLHRYLARLPMPVYLIPGNHDDRANLAAAFTDHAYLPRDSFLHYVIEDWPVRLIGLDTVLPGDVGGGLCGERLRWLADRLDEQPERPTLIFMHHPPFVSGIHFLDTPFLGAEDMARIIRRRPQVRQIVCGHLHRTAHHSWAGTTAAIAPSIVYQMALALGPGDGFFMINQPPAISLYYWPEEPALGRAPVGYLSLIGMVENRPMAETCKPLPSRHERV